MLNLSAKSFVFYVTQNYSFSILRPLQAEILKHGGQVAWFIDNTYADIEKLSNTETSLQTVTDVIKYCPDAVFVPGDVVPHFFPGIKVQLFHGFDWKKKNAFQVRGFFDLYCTHGEMPTAIFKKLAKKHGDFNVVETGWPKVDPLFTMFEQHKKSQSKTSRPTILFAPTFSPRFTAAPALFDVISKLSKTTNYQWIIRFHPKMAQHWLDKYQTLVNENLAIDDNDDVLITLCQADIMISDTSSIITEFGLLGKTVITLNNADPDTSLINITHAQQLPEAILEALTPSETLQRQITEHIAKLHPYQDGQSSLRVLKAVVEHLNNPPKLKQKPLNIIRKYKMWKKYNYFQW